jgi:hypothetical protein
MSEIKEKLNEYVKESERFLEKIERVEKRIEEANQQKIVIEQESVSNRCKLLQEALTIIEQTSEEPAIKTFVARCRQFISPREMWLVIMRLDEIGVKNIKVGGLLGRFGAEYIEDEVLTVRVIGGYKNTLRISCNHQTGTIYKIETITDIDC